MPIVAAMRKAQATGLQRKAVGPAIRAIREMSGLSVSGLARKLGVTQGYVSNVELGHKQPTTEFLVRTAQALGCDLAAISYIPEYAPAPEMEVAA